MLNLKCLNYIIFPIGVPSDRDNGDSTQFPDCVTLADPDGMIFFYCLKQISIMTLFIIPKNSDQAALIMMTFD